MDDSNTKLTGYAVKLYSDVDNPEGIPDGWPAEVIPLYDDSAAPDGYKLMTESDLSAQRAANQDAFNAFNFAKIQKEQAVNAIVFSNKDRSIFGKTVLQELQTYLIQKNLTAPQVFSLMSLVAPCVGVIGFGFIPAAAVLVTNLSANAVLDAPYSPTDIDSPVINAGETFRQHIVSRLLQGI